jgi:hypothetical protein
MHQSSTLYIGMDVPKDSIAVADVAQEHGAEVTSLGTTAPGRPTLINSSAGGNPQPNTSSLSMKRVSVGTGSLVI